MLRSPFKLRNSGFRTVLPKTSSRFSFNVLNFSTSDSKPMGKPPSVGSKADIESRGKYDSGDDPSKWVTLSLKSEDSEEFDKMLGVDHQAALLAMTKAFKVQPKSEYKNEPATTTFKRYSERSASKPAVPLHMNKIRGFLELNPQICSGCGTPFQAKSPDAPGYLSKERMVEHKIQAEFIRSKQEAIKLIRKAGVNANSAMAEEILLAAGVSPDVISSVRKMMNKKKNKDKDSDDQSTNNKSTSLAPKPATDGASNSEESTNGDGDEDEELKQLEYAAGVTEEDLSHEELLKLAEAYEAGLNNGVATLKEVKDGMKKKKKAFIAAHNKDDDPTSNGSDNSNDYEPGAEAAATSVSAIEGGEAGSAVVVKKHSSSNDDNITDLDTDGVCICQRCFRLQQYGKVQESLRPGWSDHELLSPERFEKLLAPIRTSRAVVLCLVDIFDMQGSLLPNLRQIAGPNPVIIAANKVDLLPKNASFPRITNWIHSEVRETCGLYTPEPRRVEHSLKDIIGDAVIKKDNIHLVSCETGYGMEKLMTSVVDEAKDHGNKIFVMGAANVGKSSFINRLLETKHRALRGTHRKDELPLATVSNLPGTTLDFLKIRLPNGMTMIDTPGLLNPGQLTSRLNTEELKAVVPRKQVNAVTLRVEVDKRPCVLIGGLARIELIEGRPTHFTFFVSNDVKLHPLRLDRDPLEFMEKHAGGLLSPPFEADRMKVFQPFVNHDFEIEGDSWQKSNYDIVIAGLGWIAVTGNHVAKIRVSVPEGTSVNVRPSLMPFELFSSSVRFTGGRMMKKSKSGLRGVGHRA